MNIALAVAFRMAIVVAVMALVSVIASGLNRAIPEGKIKRWLYKQRSI